MGEGKGQFMEGLKTEGRQEAEEGREKVVQRPHKG